MKTGDSPLETTGEWQRPEEIVLLLNNDTIVSKGWLEALLSLFKEHPEVGLVGPMSNYVAGPQLVTPIPYSNIEQMRRFTRKWSDTHKGQTEECFRLVGFCLLMRRSAIDRIGGLDEQFGLGNFEDDDLCIRAAMAGFKARISKEVFIHHTGSQTFIGAGIDYRQSLSKELGNI